jgi:hypothetical protein
MTLCVSFLFFSLIIFMFVDVLFSLHSRQSCCAFYDDGVQHLVSFDSRVVAMQVSVVTSHRFIMRAHPFF